MPVISSDTQGLIVAYLALEGFGQAPVKSLQNTVKTWLEGLVPEPEDDDGGFVFTLSNARPHPLKSGASAVRAYKYHTKDGLTELATTDAEVESMMAVFYGYGANIRKSQTANRQGTGRKPDDYGVPMPVRTIKANKFNYNGWMFRNIYRLAMGTGLDPDYLRRVDTVAARESSYLDQFDVETDDWTFNAADAPTVLELSETIDTTIPETSTPSEPFTPFVPAEAAPGQKIKNPAELEETRFPDITPPTAEEEISLSTREWKRLGGITDEEAPAYDYDGEVLIRFSPSPSDPTMQPIASLIAGETTVASPDDFFDDFEDEDTEDEDEDTPEQEILPDVKWFMTPELEFSFKRGSDAFFRVIGDEDDTYEGQMWPVRIDNFLTPTRVTDVKVYWAEPSLDTLDTITGCRIKLTQEGVTAELVIKNGKCTDGFVFNKSKGTGSEGYNLMGGLAQPAIPSNTVVIYGHEIKGFSGLLNDTDVAPTDTLTWSNLNNQNKGGDYTGDVNLAQSAQINSAIQTQISRFYGNPNITDIGAYWKNWTTSGPSDEVLQPIAGGNNIIFNLSPNVSIQADIRLYEETNPAYLRPKALKLDIGDVITGEVPAATEEIGVIAPLDGIWSQYVEFICKEAKSSEYFPTYAGKQEFMFPGDEKYLSFIIGYNEVDGESVPITVNVDRIADSIQYITYDLSSVTEKESNDETNLVVPAVRLAILETTMDDDMNESSEIKFVTIPDAESDFIAIDRNGELIGGTIEGGELSPPDPQIVIRNIPQIQAFRRIENVRRAAKQSPAFTIRQDDEIVTNSIAWLMSDQIYYIVATDEEGESSLVKIDLRIGRDD